MGIIEELRHDDRFMANVVTWRTLPAQSARYRPIPSQLHPTLQAALHERDFTQLYSHQTEAITQTLAGKNVAVVTPTASGKTLCYNAPVLHTMLAEPNSRALYLFPTKALAQDQLKELRQWTAEPAFSQITVATYDGDTPSAKRASIRKQTHIILSNPDMVHMGILPYHTNWADFFTNLRYIVIDEMHVYRGVFGSHVANVLRRLQRICTLYGSQPRFICTSATIANPKQLAKTLIEQPVILVDQNGAPRNAKHVILYNPPITDPERGIRRGSVLTAQELAARCVLGGQQTIVFGRSRLATELVLTYLREQLKRKLTAESAESAEVFAESNEDIWFGPNDTPPHPLTPSPPHPLTPSQIGTAIRGYRGGYLPELRRDIEAGLRNGDVRGVVATNALELGIDIGQLQAVVLCGYPGSIASTWQQIGRVGRQQDSQNDGEAGLAIIVATAGVLDQYIIQHPEFLFEESPEHALINPDNLMLLVEHIRCAAFESPFRLNERLGQCALTQDVLQFLIEEGDVYTPTQTQHTKGPHYFWSGEGYPAHNVGLRSASGQQVVIQKQSLITQAGKAITEENSRYRPEVIGEVDVESAPFLVHDGAVYIHEGLTYRVQEFDRDENIANVTPLIADFYTQVNIDTTIEVIETYDEAIYFDDQDRPGHHVIHGDILMTTQVVGYRQIKNFTHETLGVTPLDYPPQQQETSGYWFSILPHAQRQLEMQNLWHDSINDYGPNWQQQRAKVRERDDYRCTQCGAPEPKSRQHDVHHLVPFRVFGYVPELNEHYLEANRLDNLVLVCRTCHQRLESLVRVRTGLDGVAHVLQNLAPLYLMCDPSDIGVHIERGTATVDLSEPTSTNQQPTITIYERTTAGLGFSLRLFELHETLLQAGKQRIESCRCAHGCPACVGPVLEAGLVEGVSNEQVQLPTKRLALAILNLLE
ncbi:MAG: DEAD/DEAH box helicase [Chloroflexota bacterium]